eukprot:scaffold457137_cov32-Prasinocladus_malaysianus.AAC.1
MWLSSETFTRKEPEKAAITTQNNRAKQDMKWMMKLGELRLGWNQLGPVGADPIAGALRGNGALKRLDVSNNALTDTGGSHFGVCLQENNVLEARPS